MTCMYNRGTIPFFHSNSRRRYNSGISASFTFSQSSSEVFDYCLMIYLCNTEIRTRRIALIRHHTHRCQNPNDRHHHEEFNQTEAVLGQCMAV